MVLKYKGYNRTRDKLWTITYIHTFDLNYNWGHYWGTRTEAIVGTFYFESHRQILPWFCWRKKDFDLFTSKWMLRGLNRMLRKKNSHGRNATVSLSTYDDSNGLLFFLFSFFHVFCSQHSCGTESEWILYSYLHRYTFVRSYRRNRYFRLPPSHMPWPSAIFLVEQLIE